MIARHDTFGNHLLVALGGNLPFGNFSPSETILAALQALAREGFETIALSRLYRTPCFPVGAGPDYVNAAAILRNIARDDVTEIIGILHRVEAEFGRERSTRWGGRTLDIDLVGIGDSVLPDAATQDRWRLLPPEAQAKETPDRPILPHPRLQDRAFVLVPLADVAPEWVHPRLGLSVAEMLVALPDADRAAVVPL